ncbi:GyrI-like domain-containing protein [Bacillus spongiae]|uniref:GyrI-like domain-containing protein n=1 Tax=Bacillus spongiae TaxID=2683610 RepID=A0ABU8HFD1_9BACI
MSEKLMTPKCKIISKEYTLVGISSSAPFPSAFPEEAIRLQKQFWQRKKEVKNALNKQVLVSPYLSNGIIATYFASLEVTDLNSIPEGMTGFIIPTTKYAAIECTNRSIEEGYTHLFNWMEEKGYRLKTREAFQMELFYINDSEEEIKVELLMPIES